MRLKQLILMIGLLGSLEAYAEGPDPVNLELFIVRSEIQTTVQEVVKAFELENPGIRLEVIHIPNDENETLKKRIKNKNLPELIQVWSLEQKTLLPEGSVMDLTREPMVKNVQGTFLSEVTSGSRVSVLPTDFDGIGILYNKKIFKKLGLNPPQTFGELKRTAEIIKKNGLIPFSGLLRENWSLGHIFTMIHTNLLEVQGGPEALRKFIEAMNQGKTSFGAGMDRLFEIFDFYVDNTGPEALEAGWDDQQNHFLQGKAAMMVQGLWSYGYQRYKTLGVDAGFIPFPVTENPRDSRFYAGIETSFAISAWASPEKQAAAKKFLSWLSAGKGAKLWSEIAGATTFHSNPPGPQWGEPYVQLYDQVLIRGRVPWAFPQYPLMTWEGAVKDSAWGYAHKKMTKEDAIRAIDESWAEEIKKRSEK